MIRRGSATAWFIFLALCLAAGDVFAARVADIQNTRHNFSATVIPSLPGGASRNAYADSESQVCAFCHTPHGATQAPRAPLWNRKLTPGATYTPYTSGSLDAVDLGAPSAKSKLCLSCHDGTLALGSVNVLNRQTNVNVPITGPGAGPGGTIPEGLGADTGFTRKLGVDLTNDHPISLTYDSSQAARDGELRDPAVSTSVHDRKGGSHPTLPLEDNKLECISCHDPHIRDPEEEAATGVSIKFLRVNRFQKTPPVGGEMDPNSDIICLGCHDKAGWIGSAHANQAVGNERYAGPAAKLREFPQNTQVWQAACLNCHDTHTVQGSRRLLREGTDGPVQVDANGAKYKQGGNPAIEETCYACHSADGETLQGQGTANFEVPNIKTDFTTMLRHMPINSADQPAGREVHNISKGVAPQSGKDFMETRQNLGRGNLTNRHAECTDCHNPHRVTKNRLFWNDTSVPATEGTHNHTAAQVANNPEGVHTNIASGVLRGIFGVEPIYGDTKFGSEPVDFQTKRGDPGTNTATDVDEPYVTREYQVCLKCHSNYAYNQPPNLGSFTGGTPPGTNNVNQYTNQGMEYQSPIDHTGEGTSGSPSGSFQGVDGGGNTVDYVTDNHRAWHPVLRPTGRTPAVRGADANNWLEPFNLGVGIQTMYCTDCHGSATAPGSAIPNGGEQGSPWGPHGSNNDFLLKGPWSDQTHGDVLFGFGGASPGTTDALCFKCHDYNSYGKAVFGAFRPGGISGFRRATNVFGCAGFQGENLHSGHLQVVQNFRCTYCHISVPHGWKNKNFLVNLNDVGLEVGLAPGTQVRNNTSLRYYNGPYYNGSVLKVRNFARSGNWVPTNCGSAGPPGNGLAGINWMQGFGGETCSNLP